jgi:hypothetical protein
MKYQKNRSLKRKTIKRNRKTIKRNRKTIKRNHKTIKRKQNKKITYSQKKCMAGGSFNLDQQEILKGLLIENENLNFTDEELKDVMTKLNSVAQVYWKRHFEVLKIIIRNSQSKQIFNTWLEKECCSGKYKGVTDSEDSENSDDMADY